MIKIIISQQMDEAVIIAHPESMNWKALKRCWCRVLWAVGVCMHKDHAIAAFPCSWYEMYSLAGYNNRLYNTGALTTL
jgi:hypothetical protein